MNHISVEDIDTWLNLRCRYSTEFSLCLIPSPEELSLIFRSENPGPDVVRYAPAHLHFHVVSDSTLVWGKKPRGGIHDALPAVCHVLDTARC